MKDPYEVLGISKNATDEEVKSAYKNLARKYHPDNYANNPLSDLAEEKMKEINEAYDSIMTGRKSGGSRNSGSGGFNANGGSGEYADIRSLIAQNRLEQAQELLDGVDISRRNAEWYYLNGSVLYRRGWYDDAYASFSRACNLDPSNLEYRQALNRMAQARQGSFNGGYRTTSGASDCDFCSMCSTLWCADTCCECMGGDICRCM